MFRRIIAILAARNREFYRDRVGLGWNLFMPLAMLLAFAFIFPAESGAPLKIGIVTPGGDLAHIESPVLALEHVNFVPVTDTPAAIRKVARHQLDLLLAPGSVPTYWVNDGAAKGYLAERLILGGDSPEPASAFRRQVVSGVAPRYVDWLVPAILALNVMFSSLWGVGWVIVRYRKNGVLRRLKVTPLRVWEFLVAQVLSRMLMVLAANTLVYLTATLLLDFPMRGSHLALILMCAVGAFCMSGLGLIVAARLRAEEVADGALNLVATPMLLLCGVWFSMEGASATAQAVSRLLPLTYLVEGARAVMLDGVGLLAILPQLAALLAFGIVFLAIATWLFRWE